MAPKSHRVVAFLVFALKSLTELRNRARLVDRNLTEERGKPADPAGLQGQG